MDDNYQSAPSISSKVMSYMRRPAVYCVALANLLSPLALQADEVLRQGKEAALVDYLAQSRSITTPITSTAVQYGGYSDKKEALDDFLGAMSNPKVQTETRTDGNLNLLLLINKENGQLLAGIPYMPTTFGSIEDKIQELNGARSSPSPYVDYQAAGCACHQSYQQPVRSAQQPPTTGYCPGPSAAEQTTNMGHQCCGQHRKKKGGFLGGLWNVIKIGAMVYGGIKLIKWIGGGTGGGSHTGAAAGSGFHHGGTSVIDPITGGLHR